MKTKNALLSLYTKAGSEIFAQDLINRGFCIISSGGTASYLIDRGIPVTDVSEITGYPPILGHRVVTLAPQIHGGLLATPSMREELDKLGWPWVDLLYVNFYPLAEELNRSDATFESCLEKTDIGGPTMVRSAVKGGRHVLTHPDDAAAYITWLDNNQADSEYFVRNLLSVAERTVAEYVELSAQVHERFVPR